MDRQVRLPYCWWILGLRAHAPPGPLHLIRMRSNDGLQLHALEFGELALEVGKDVVLGDGDIHLVQPGLQLLQGLVLDVGPRLWHISALGIAFTAHYDFLEYYPVKSP